MTLELWISNFLKLKDENVVPEFRKNMAFVGKEKFVSAINKNAKIFTVFNLKLK